MKTFKQHITEANIFANKMVGSAMALGAASGLLAFGRSLPAGQPQQQSTHLANNSTPATQQKSVKTYHHDVIRKTVIADEGMKLKVYKDTKGIRTVGVGHNLEAKNSENSFVKAFGKDGKSIRSGLLKGKKLNKDQALKLFDSDYDEHLQRTVKLIPNLHQHTPEVQSVLVSGVYRGHVTDSPTFRKHFNGGKYTEAAKEFLNRDEYRNPKKDEAGNIIAPGVLTRLKRDHAILSDHAKKAGK